MADDTALSLLSSEFKLWGIRFEHQKTGGGHIEVLWQVSPDKPIRKTYIPSSQSDHRGWLNKRAEVRRLFQQDGLSLKEPKPVSILQKALSLPKPVETDREQITAMRAEIADLTNMVIELGSIISSLVPQEPIIQQPISPPKKPSVRSIKTIEYVSQGWNSTEALARAMDVLPGVAYHKLYYLMKKGDVEMENGRWRLKPKIIAPKNGKQIARLHA